MSNNQLQKPRFSAAIQTDGYKKLINSTLQDPKRSMNFIATISSAVATNPVLQECDAGSILSAALVGEALGLSPSPQLGQFYLVPFNKKIKTSDGKTEEIKQAQFILGAKGYKQLAMRSGQYQDIDCIEVKAGEFLGRDKKTGKFIFEFNEDEDIRETLPTIGYLAYFELLNGFKKSLYWTKEKMENHADTYSQAFNMKSYRDLLAGKIPKADLWKYSSFWYKSFSEMAEKTMIRQLLSKWGILSIEMQRAMDTDTAVINQDGTCDYVDNDEYKDSIPGTIVEQKDEPQKVDEPIEVETISMDDLK